MMSRAFLIATAVAMVFADDYKADCSSNGAQCGVVCCSQGWTLMGSDGSYWCKASGDGDDCQLCGSGLPDCSFKSSMHATLVDENNDPVSSVSTSMGGMASSSLEPTTPSSGVTMTLGTYDGMNGWHDIPASRFYNFLEFLIGVVATIPSFYTAAGYSVLYSCQSQGLLYVPSDFKGCNIFFFVYRCPPCEAFNGNIGQELLTMDEPTWYVQNCGPTFKLDYQYGIEHQFAVYMAEIADGETATVVLQERIEFMFWAMVGKSVICSARLTEDECNEAPINCEWIEHMGVCRPRACPPRKGWRGPSDRCKICVADELEYVPEVIFN